MDRRNSLRGVSPEKPPVAEQSTADLINGVSKLQIQRTPTRSTLPPQWESTMSYLGADFANLDHHQHSANAKAPYNVSESTVFLDRDHNLISPLRRTVSGSSMEMLLTKETVMDSSGRPETAPEAAHPEIDFDFFYQLIARLPSTARNVHFKGILSHYLEILREHDLDPSSDKFIITIYNQLRTSTHDYSKLEKVIDVFINEPCNEAMKLSNFLHFREYNSQARMLKLWVIKRRKFSELLKSEKIWKIYTRKKFMMKWLFKYGVYTEDFEENAVIFRKVKSEMKFWDIWLANLEEKDSLSNLADLQFEAKFFKKWKKRGCDLDVDPESIYQTNLLKNNFRLWGLKRVEKTAMIKEKMALQKWKTKYHSTIEMVEEAKYVELALHGGFFFTKWRQKYNQVASKQEELDIIYDAHMKSKYLHIWSEQLKFRSVENCVLDRREHFLKQFVMEQFKKRFNNDQKARTFTATAELERQRSFFKIWRLKLCCRAYQRTLQGKSFNTWSRKHTLALKEKEFELLGVTQRAWEKWNVSLMKRQNSLELGCAAFESYTKVVYYKNWRAALEKNRAGLVKADQHFAGVFLKKWKQKKSSNAQMSRDADHFHDRESSSLATKRFLNRWTDRLDRAKEAKLMKQMPVFEKVADDLRCRAVVESWHSVHRHLLEQEHVFRDEYLKELHIRPIFLKWVDQWDILDQMNTQADAMNSMNLLSSGFTKLQLAYYRTQELEEKLLEYREDQDLKSVLKYLNVWSLQQMKARRDNEIVARFQKRWNRAHMRAILLLWQGKASDAVAKRYSPLTDDFESLDGDETIDIGDLPRFISVKQETGGDDDDSPTKNKGRLRTASPFIGVQTPKKSIIETYGGTGNTRERMPGSERIRRRRIDALKSHYSQIKYAIPSPLKSRGGTPQVSKTTGLTGSTKKLDFGDLSIFRNRPEHD